MSKLGTLKYRKVKNNNKNTAAYGKWYALAVQDRTMEFDEFIQHVSEHNSPYSRGTIQGVVTDMLDCLQEQILDGKSVRLGELGLFSIGMTSEGSATSAECTAQKVKGVHLIIRNTKTWSNAELRKLCKIEELEKNAVVDDATGTDDTTDGDSTSTGDAANTGDNGGSTGDSDNTQGSGSGNTDGGIG